MIKSVHDYQIDDVFKKDAGFCYVIPKYQREYTWGQYQWKDLYDDICENDNGYFIGSIICIDNSSDAFQTKELEVVDGQQRLTTLCLLLTAIYNRLAGTMISIRSLQAWSISDRCLNNVPSTT